MNTVQKQRYTHLFAQSDDSELDVFNFVNISKNIWKYFDKP